MSARMRFKPYPAYKDSGVEWLGKIPAHWDVKRLKQLGTMRAGAAITSERIEAEGDYPVYGGNGIRGYTAAYTHEGDFPLIGRQGALCGCVTFASGKFWASEHAVAMSASPGTDPHWLTALLQSMRLNDYSQSAAQPGLSVETIAAVRAPSPPEAEQRAIASFLDRETGRIDALVAKKERLIELLQEKRTALITQAVTKGLDPNVPMKDSGVEWLGEIPEHWELEKNRWTFRESDRRSEFGGEELLTVSHLTGVTRRADKPEVTMIEAESHEGYKVCQKDDLAINTMWAWMGALGIARELGMVSPSYNVFRITNPALVANYYDYLCRIPRHVTEIIRRSKGIWQSRLRLYPDAFLEIHTPVPPKSEQIAIVALLGRETARIEALAGEVRDAISRLKELRTALVSAAVTGKIDVRQEPA
jgi:type I restriction enzyme S subunit